MAVDATTGPIHELDARKKMEEVDAHSGKTARRRYACLAAALCCGFGLMLVLARKSERELFFVTHVGERVGVCILSAPLTRAIALPGRGW